MTVNCQRHLIKSPTLNLASLSDSIENLIGTKEAIIPEMIPIIMQTLDKFYETSQVIELKNFPFLEGFITEIFTSRNPVNI